MFKCLDGQVILAAGFVEGLKRLFPELDIASQLRSVQAWLLMSDGKKPDCGGLQAFIYRWLEREKKEVLKMETPYQKRLREREEGARRRLMARGLSLKDFGVEM